MKTIFTDSRLNIVTLFYKFDRDNSNSLDIYEFCKLINYVDSTISRSVAESIFRTIDENNDKILDLQEVKKYFQVPDKFNSS